MRLLLDSHVLLWWFFDDRRLSAAPRGLIADRGNEIAVSAASTWEISIKRALGKLSAPDDLALQVREAGFTRWPISLEDGVEAGDLPRHHGDPFDRMLIAQAAGRGFAVLTSDAAFADYDVAVVPA